MPLPVYILSCPTDTPRSQVLSQLVRGASPERVAAIVPGRRRKKSPDRTRDGVPLIHTRERMVRMGKGCACCTVRGDILQKVRAVAQTGETDQLVIQVPPATDLSVLAKTFTVPDSHGAVLSDTANLHTLIVVVTVEELRSGSQSAQVRPLVERIELAQVVLLDGSSNQSPSELAAAERVVQAINPHAVCIDLASEAATLSQLQGKVPFDLESAKERAELLDLFQDETAPRSDRLAFQARRPFHPQRLHTWLATASSQWVRARGTFWVASRPHLAARLDVAMGHMRTEVLGNWWAAISEAERPADPAFRAYLQEIWDPTFGDRRQELGFVGINLDADALRTELTACLLTDEELTEPERFTSGSHPFQWKEAQA